MRVLITGDKGFVGSETKRVFREHKIETIGYDILDGKDIRDYKQIDQTIQETKPDRILHLAAIARFAEADKNALLAFETNVLGTLNVALAASRHHIPLVYSSTGSVYMPIAAIPPITEEFSAQGNSVYGCTKLAGEKYVEKLCSPFIILRYAHLYGKEKRMHGLVGGFIERIQRGLAPLLYGGRQSNDFTYIKDVALANYIAISASWDKWNQIYNIGTGEEINAEDAGKIICKLSGYKGKIERCNQRTVDPQRFVYDCGKADRMLGFRAEYSFEKGLKDMFSDESLSKYLG